MNRAEARIALGATTLAALVLFACVGSDPELVTATPDGGTQSNDSGSNDSGSNDSGSTPAGTNILERSDFEAAGCLGWKLNSATSDLDPDNHSGSSACRVCGENSTPVWGIYQEVDGPRAGPYTVTAFVRPSGDAGPDHVNLVGQLIDDAGAELGNRIARRIDIAVGDPWQTRSFDIEVRSGTGLSVAVITDDTQTGCFLVDDFTLTPK